MYSHLRMKTLATNLRLFGKAAASSGAGFVAAAALLAYILQPYVRFLPSNTAIGGVVLAISLVGYHAAAANKDFDKVAARAVVGGLGVFLLMLSFFQAEDESWANDRRCLAIQRDMLSAQPRRHDGPDLFQALGCRPQGEGSVYAAPVGRKRMN